MPIRTTIPNLRLRPTFGGFSEPPPPPVCSACGRNWFGSQRDAKASACCGAPCGQVPS